MTRREFLKGAAGLVIACGTGFGALDRVARALDADAPEPIGPMLVDGLKIVPGPDGADVYYGAQKVFVVNAPGRRLLQKADGLHTMDALVQAGGGEVAAERTAMFFVTLGKAGYLRNRVEVTIVEHTV